jgi:hypothetical protein
MEHGIGLRRALYEEVKVNKFMIVVTTILPSVLLMPKTADAQTAQWSNFGAYGGYSNNWDAAFTFKIAGQTSTCGDQFYVDWKTSNSKQLYSNRSADSCKLVMHAY